MKLKMFIVLLVAISLLLGSTSTSAEQCGRQAAGALCADGLCCSEYGWCGNTPDHCGTNCQSQCAAVPGPSTPPPTTPTPSGGGGVDTVISQALFDELLKHRNDPVCQGNGFYTYEAFIAAARSFDGFGTTGDADVRKKEVAAFLAQTSHETTGGGPQSEDGPYAWGYCFVTEQDNPGDYCNKTSLEWPCAPGKKYYGRGPIQLTHNYNYGPAGEAIGADLLSDPDLVASNPEISFKTAMWFWMTPQWNKPSSHDVITGRWTPSDADRSANRVPGFGVITNIINGGLECGQGANTQVENRVGYYRRYCSILGVNDESNLDCNNQAPFS